MKKAINILEVNNLDEEGRRFNGYDLVEYINSKTIHSAKQVVNAKKSLNKNVISLYENNFEKELESRISLYESENFSVHSIFSLGGFALKEKNCFKNASMVHYHMFHNTKMSLISLKELSKLKPTIITLHDPWFMTGHCVHPSNCGKWKTGCSNCKHLDYIFELNEDNSSSLWKLKQQLFNNRNIDIVVTTPFMLDMVNKSPIMKNVGKVHLIPFGVDTKKFCDDENKEKIREKYNINKDEIVLFFRAQKYFKGTEYIVEAMKKFDGKKNIVLMSCSNIGLLDELKDKYHIIDLGVLNDDEMINAYRACDIFLMPSIAESFGFMAVEAMSCSRPVIVFDNTSLPSVTFAPECGYLVKNKDSKDLMKAIKILSEDNEEREKRGKLGREYVCKYYDLDKYNKSMISLYESKSNEIIKEKSNEKELYESDIDSKKQLLYLNYSLKKMTKSLFCVFPKQFAFLKQNYNYFKPRKVQLDFSNKNIQLIINKYNKCLYEEYLAIKDGTSKYHNNYLYHIKHKIKTFGFLLIHDRKKLIITLKNKLILKQRSRHGKKSKS